MDNKMKFYDFSTPDYPYSATIMARSSDEAVEYYIQVVSDVDEEDLEMCEPFQITKSDVIKEDKRCRKISFKESSMDSKEFDGYYGTFKQFKKMLRSKKAELIFIDVSLF